MKTKVQTISENDRLFLTYYTDPLCCWSWGMHAAISKLKEEYETASWRYVVGGLIPDWQNFCDPVNSVTRPLQMGPVWMHASQVSGVSIDHNLWFRDPPISSYPACIAFKAVQLQSQEHAITYLRLLWETCMMHGKNISKQKELIDVAARLNLLYPHFDIKTFQKDLTNGKGLEAFKSDVHEIKINNIARFPTLTIRIGQQCLLLTGYSPYERLVKAIDQLSASAYQ